MEEVIRFKNDNNTEPVALGDNLEEVARGILYDTAADISKKCIRSIPIAELASLGAGVSFLMPSMESITQVLTASGNSLYKLADAEISEVIEAAKTGDFLPLLKRISSSHKLVKNKSNSNDTSKNNTVMPVNPASIMMAAALYSIKQQMRRIVDMEEQILSFLKAEKQSQIEGDIETLVSVINKYTDNWDNPYYTASNHKLVLDIQRTARANMLHYQKDIKKILESEKRLFAKTVVDQSYDKLQKQFEYYRLSLYSFSLSSFLEIMLSGNFKEEYITLQKDEIEDMTMAYRGIFMVASRKLESMAGASIETNITNSLGTAGKAAGKFIGSIPFVKEGPIDELLQEGGEQLKGHVVNTKRKIIGSFAELSDPNTGVFLEKMRDMIDIYNHTSGIFFDSEQIYLVTD